MNSIDITNFAQKIFTSEINAIISVKNKIGVDFEETIKAIFDASGKVVVVGVGKNMPIAKKFVATLNSTGTSAQFLHAAEAMHGDLGLVDEKDIAIVLSKSGNTPEIRSLLPALKKQSNKIIAITGNLDSTLAKFSDFILDTTVDEEAGPFGIAPTSSTTVQLVMCDAIAMTLMKLNNFQPEDFGRFHPGGTLGKQLSWTVEDVVDSSQKPSVEINASINEVIQSLSSGRFGITVVEDNTQIVGVITNGDLRRMLESHDSFKDLTAKDIATFNPKTISKNTYAKDALKLINDYKIGQLVVLDDENKYFGIIDFHALTNEGISAE